MNIGPSVVIVEDDIATQRLLCDVLKHSGYICHIAGNAEDGITMAAELIPDVIIMDIKLPGMDGLNATDILRSMESLDKTLIVGMSAHVVRNDNDLIDKNRFDFFLSKPFSYRVLLNYLGSAIESPG